MTIIHFSNLILVYILSLTLVAALIYREAMQASFTFNIFFSLIYLLTFYLGFPFTFTLILRYHVDTVPVDNLCEALLVATTFYGIYYISYKIRFFSYKFGSQLPWFNINRTEIHLLWLLLMFVSVITALIFFMQNGLLLFQQRNYNQIFSSDVFNVALKRFFYFFIPSMLIIFFLKPTKYYWIIFLILTTAFGIFTYLLVGGTRANIIISFALFLLIGIQRGWITLWILLGSYVIAIMSMLWLALKRYGLKVSGNEAFYTFLYLTRDTFSPWENLALLLQKYNSLNFQWIAPIIRDFYVFIPSWFWPDRPSLVLNTANYFTWEVLGNHSGLAISPTLIGSFLIMGGISFIPIGAVVVGFIIKGFDSLYECSKTAGNCYRASLIQSFCFSAIFNIIVLVREGIDAFISRLVFFCLIFGLCLLIAKLLFLLFQHSGLIRSHIAKLNNYNIVP